MTSFAMVLSIPGEGIDILLYTGVLHSEIIDFSKFCFKVNAEMIFHHFKYPTDPKNHESIPGGKDLMKFVKREISGM